MAQEAKAVEPTQDRPQDDDQAVRSRLPKTFVQILERAQDLKHALEGNPALSKTGHTALGVCRDAEFAVEEVRLLRYRIRKSESSLDRFRDSMATALGKIEAALRTDAPKDDLAVARALAGARRALRAGKAPGGSPKHATT